MHFKLENVPNLTFELGIIFLQHRSFSTLEPTRGFEAHGRGRFCNGRESLVASLRGL